MAPRGCEAKGATSARRRRRPGDAAMGLKGDLGELRAQRPHRDDLAGGQVGPAGPLRRGRARPSASSRSATGCSSAPRTAPSRPRRRSTGCSTCTRGRSTSTRDSPVDDESCQPADGIVAHGRHAPHRRDPAAAPAVPGAGRGRPAQPRRRSRTTRVEARVLGYIGPGARSVGDIVEGILVGGEFDEYDALKALRPPARARRGPWSRIPSRARRRAAPPQAGPPQPELER